MTCTGRGLDLNIKRMSIDVRLMFKNTPVHILIYAKIHTYSFFTNKSQGNSDVISSNFLRLTVDCNRCNTCIVTEMTLSFSLFMAFHNKYLCPSLFSFLSAKLLFVISKRHNFWYPPPTFFWFVLIFILPLTASSFGTYV